ncbi:MAG: hypothetical protein KF729_03265 [Sandaracinaceae bacterium]|nr:hypothetical protein [Sandaracinaceae bacterium]
MRITLLPVLLSALATGCLLPSLGEPVDLREERVVVPTEDERDCAPHDLDDALPPPALLATNRGCDARDEAFCFALAADLREVAALASPREALARAAHAYDTGDLERARAFADLAVSGARSYAAFAADPPMPGAIGGSAAAEAFALERAYHVAWALRGPAAHRARARGPLGWIAVSPEDDAPGRPIAVHAAPWPQHDVVVDVPTPVEPRAVRTRVVIASTDPAPEPAVPAELVGAIPPARPPLIPADHEVILFVHGHTSLAEEGAGLFAALIDEAGARGRALSIVAMDLPSNAYSERVDPRAIVDTFGGDDAVLRFLDAFLVALVDALGVRDRVRAAIGGSLGGNLVLRLAEGGHGWPRAIVAWSPASIDFSWSLARLPFAARDGEMTDVVKHEAVRVTREAWSAPETSESRRDYFVGGLSSLRDQAAYWYRPGWSCNERFVREGLRQVGETYGEHQRRWHYRVAYEQLVFSHLAVEEDGERRFSRITAPLLLVAGDADDLVPMTTYSFVRRLSRHLTADGPTLLLADTGHALHCERPRLLAAEIAAFLDAH